LRKKKIKRRKKLCETKKGKKLGRVKFPKSQGKRRKEPVNEVSFSLLEKNWSHKTANQYSVCRVNWGKNERRQYRAVDGVVRGENNNHKN